MANLGTLVFSKKRSNKLFLKGFKFLSGKWHKLC
jgi:hypothetical protein